MLEDDDDVWEALESQVQVYVIGSEDPEEESESGGLMVCSMSKRYCPGLRFHLLENTCKSVIARSW